LSFDENTLDINSLNLSLEESPLDLNLDDYAADPPLELEDEFNYVKEFESIDLSNAVIDEPDLSIGLDEPLLEEPVLDDLPLRLDDFNIESVFSADHPTELDAKDDSIAEVIPEGFETSIVEESVPFDEDIEALVDDDLVFEDDDIPGIPESTELNIPADSESGAAEKAPEVSAGDEHTIPSAMKDELRGMFSYMDHLLESLPEDKIKEFAQSEHFDSYRKIFKELGLMEE
jgi:hypothetical protein